MLSHYLPSQQQYSCLLVSHHFNTSELPLNSILACLGGGGYSVIRHIRHEEICFSFVRVSGKNHKYREEIEALITLFCVFVCFCGEFFSNRIISSLQFICFKKVGKG